MIYDLSKELDKVQFKTRCNALFRRATVVELTEKTRRSTSQNSYLHTILAYFAKEYGESLEYVKEKFYKEAWNADLFVREKDDAIIGRVTYLRSSRDLTKEEMTTSIERFRNHSSKDAGIYLPSPEEEALVREMENEVKHYERYL